MEASDRMKYLAAMEATVFGPELAEQRESPREKQFSQSLLVMSALTDGERVEFSSSCRCEGVGEWSKWGCTSSMYLTP